MSRLYDTVEPSVITEEMLKIAVYEQGLKGIAGQIAKDEGVSYEKVENLRISYKNILEIDNLWWFKNLTKLQLDNNIIEKISGLSHLINLKWLDLSFNNIEKIDGIGCLTNIEDLTLYNNRIAKIENLDLLEKLQVLSIGNNMLEDLDNLKYLRNFKNLKALNLAGNPCCKEDKFRIIVLAFLSQLVYLDYKMINEEERKLCFEKEQIHIESLQADEKEREVLLEEERLKLNQEKLYKLAFVDGLDKDQLFESLFTDDPDGQKLKELPKNTEHADDFRKKFAEFCYALFECGLQEHERREEEVSLFFDFLNGAKSTNKQSSMELISEFITYKREVINSLTNDPNPNDKVKEEYKKKVKDLQYQLMCLELSLVDQIEETFTEFERNLVDLIAKFKESVESYMGKCRELDVIYQSKVSEEALAIQEKINKGDPTDDLSEDLRMILIDKDSMTNALSASKDAHMLKIETKADEINNRVQDWFKNIINKIRSEEEIKRNRKRVLEINLLIDNFNLEIDNIDYPIN